MCFLFLCVLRVSTLTRPLWLYGLGRLVWFLRFGLVCCFRPSLQFQSRCCSTQPSEFLQVMFVWFVEFANSCSGFCLAFWGRPRRSWKKSGHQSLGTSRSYKPNLYAASVVFWHGPSSNQTAVRDTNGQKRVNTSPEASPTSWSSKTMEA